MRITQIQGLRALAAILVTVFHARLIPGGFIGVDIFYVISGYLITGLILREIENTGTLNLKTFYQRRIKRLLPTSVFVLFVTAIFAWILFPPITRGSLGRDLFAAAAYISNYLFAWWQNDYQNLNATPSPFIHYWSLAVEEQFYLVWPLFILFLARYFCWDRDHNLSFPPSLHLSHTSCTYLGVLFFAHTCLGVRFWSATSFYSGDEKEDSNPSMVRFLRNCILFT